ncbi:MAG: sodium:proton antiporter [Phototrophicaceae bacterium]
MHNDLLISIALVLGLGMLAQWVAWRLKQPSIIFLLLFGLIVGPVSALMNGHPILDVEHFLGELLFPVVSASVGVILFEGGLSLRFRDLEGTGGVVGRLVSVGVGVTWVISGVAAHFLLGLGWEMALLLGATLVVTGPTVIIPLLKQIRPQGRVGSVLRWEGIVIDPVGAILAVLVFEEIIAGPQWLALAWALFITIAVGLGIGWIAAQIMIEVYRRYWVPDSLQNPVTLSFVLTAFAISNVIQPEAGLLTVTVMGIVMANQRRFDIHHIVEFKETLQVLLLSSLFILLSARMQPDDLLQIGWPTFWFVVIIIVVERPLAALLSTIGSDLNWRERAFIGWMAPRGIVAASVASIFAIELADRGIEGANVLLPVTFAVIIGTVATYSLTSGIVARRLGLSEKNPQGLLVVGGSPWIREMAKQVKQAGYRVLLSDTNQNHVDKARQANIEIYHGNILSEVAQDEINFGGIGRLMALTPNSEVNALAGEHYQNTFGSENVFELQRRKLEERDGISIHLGGRTLLPTGITYEMILNRFLKGAQIITVEIRNAQAVQNAIPNAILPLFSLPDKNTLLLWTEIDAPTLRQGGQLIAMIEADMYDQLLKSEAIINIDNSVAKKPKNKEA